MRELYKNTRFVLGHKTTPEVVLWASYKALPNVSYISIVFVEVWWTTEKVNDKDDYNAVVHHNDHLSYLPHFVPSQPHKYCPHSTFSSPLHHYTAPFPVECPQEKGSLWRLSSAWVSMDPRVNTSAQHHSEAVCSMHYWCLPTLASPPCPFPQIYGFLTAHPDVCQSALSHGARLDKAPPLSSPTRLPRLQRNACYPV